MSLFFSIIIFILSLVIFFITYNKISKIRENIVIDDIKKEMESLITEFNATAARNIELLEDKINQIQELMKKANNKMLQLDEKIEKLNKPIVIEKIVEKKSEKIDNIQNDKIKKEKINNKELKRKNTDNSEILVKDNKESNLDKEDKKNKTINIELTRKDRLKKLILDHKNDDEIIQEGFSISEINLVRFLIRNERK